MDHNTSKNKLNGDVLTKLGFQKMSNGQFELQNDDHIVMCYFVSDGVVSVKKMHTMFSMNLQTGYQQQKIADQIKDEQELKALLDELL
jgi:hypothetical protein